MKSCIKLITVFMMAIISQTIAAQSFQRQYRDNTVYMYIDNDTQRYTISGGKLPHHRLCISNLTGSTLEVRLIMQTTAYYGNGNVKDVKTKEITQRVSPNSTSHPNFYMSSCAYYCVTGFNVLSINIVNNGNNGNYNNNNNNNNGRPNNAAPANYIAKKVKYQTYAYYYDANQSIFVNSGSYWNVGDVVYLSGKSYPSQGSTFFELLPDSNGAVWYIMQYTFE